MKRLWLTILTVLLVFVILILLTIPFSTEISLHRTAMEYSPVDERIAIPHEVVIEGTYYHKILGKDSFQGTFYVSDVQGMEYCEGNASLSIGSRNAGPPTFRDEAGQHNTTELFAVYCTQYFNDVAVLFADTYEVEENSISATANYSTGNFLVLNAQSREEALTQYKQLQNELCAN